jgi:hypothetical protein
VCDEDKTGPAVTQVALVLKVQAQFFMFPNSSLEQKFPFAFNGGKSGM